MVARVIPHNRGPNGTSVWGFITSLSFKIHVFTYILSKFFDVEKSFGYLWEPNIIAHDQKGRNRPSEVHFTIRIIYNNTPTTFSDRNKIKTLSFGSFVLTLPLLPEASVTLAILGAVLCSPSYCLVLFLCLSAVLLLPLSVTIMKMVYWKVYCVLFHSVLCGLFLYFILCLVFPFFVNSQYWLSYIFFFCFVLYLSFISSLVLVAVLHSGAIFRFVFFLFYSALLLPSATLAVLVAVPLLCCYSVYPPICFFLSPRHWYY